MTTFGAHLRQLRLERGLYQVELARRIGVQQSYLGKLERDERPPPMERVRKLIAALEVKDERTFIRLALLAHVPEDWLPHFTPISGRHL